MPAPNDLPDFAARTTDRHHVLDIDGAVHGDAVGVLRAELLARAADPGRSRLVLDLSGVTYLDNQGLSVLVGGLRRLRRAGGCLHPVGNPMVGTLLTETGLDRVLELAESVTAADSACEDTLGHQL